MKRLLCALLVLITSPAWAGTMGLDIGGGKLSFEEKKMPVWVNGTVTQFGAFPAAGHFSLVTGRFAALGSKEWVAGSGGHVNFSGCLDTDLDGDKPGHCDKKDFRGNLFTGTFKSAKILETGKNTFTLEGQLWLTPTAALATQMGVSAAPFLADITLRFTDACVPSSPASCRANIISGKVFAAAPEPTSFVLLGLGLVLAGLGHTTLLSFFRSHA